MVKPSRFGCFKNSHGWTFQALALNFEKERAVPDLFWIKFSGRHRILLACASSPPAPTTCTHRNAIFQRLKGSCEEHLDSYSKLLAFCGMNNSEDKSGLRYASTEEGSVPLTDPLSGLPDLHWERRRKESERERKVRAPTCLQGWQRGGDTGPPATGWQRFGNIIVIQGLSSFLQSQNWQRLAHGKIHVGTTAPISSLWVVVVEARLQSEDCLVTAPREQS